MPDNNIDPNIRPIQQDYSQQSAPVQNREQVGHVSGRSVSRPPSLSKGAKLIDQFINFIRNLWSSSKERTSRNEQPANVSEHNVSPQLGPRTAPTAEKTRRLSAGQLHPESPVSSPASSADRKPIMNPETVAQVMEQFRENADKGNYAKNKALFDQIEKSFSSGTVDMLVHMGEVYKYIEPEDEEQNANPFPNILHDDYQKASKNLAPEGQHDAQLEENALGRMQDDIKASKNLAPERRNVAAPEVGKKQEKKKSEIERRWIAASGKGVEKGAERLIILHQLFDSKLTDFQLYRVLKGLKIDKDSPDLKNGALVKQLQNRMSYGGKDVVDQLFARGEVTEAMGKMNRDIPFQ